MTEAEARSILRRPLRFGDERQIVAHRFLAQVEEAVSANLACKECRGRFNPHWRKGGGCLSRFPDDVVEAARKRATTDDDGEDWLE